MTTTNHYQNKRHALTNRYSRTLFVIPSGQEAQRSHSVRYRFKVSSDFYYLCGLNLSDAILIIAGPQSYLVQKNDHDQIWGEHTSIDETEFHKLSGLMVENNLRLNEILQQLAPEFDRIAMPLSRAAKVEEVVMQEVAFSRKASRQRLRPIDLCDSRSLIGTLRTVKEPSEIELLKQAGQRSSAVHELAMRQSWVGRTERELSNFIEGHFLLQDMQFTSYETIVGSGNRAAILHARATDKVILKDELILVDAGAEWRGYCADITRTWPSGRAFSEKQRQVYSLVLQAQTHALKLIRPGVTLQEIHNTATSLLSEIMPHSTSHWIGLDVHDPCAYVDDRGDQVKLEVGMCFTVEPGLYADGMGVRIEDDVVVTATGFEFLSTATKEIEEIEVLRAASDDK